MNETVTDKEAPAQCSEEQIADIIKAVSKWKNKRGSLIMALHEVQGMLSYIPWDAAKTVSRELEIPVARIYEVITFYNYFRLECPGKVIISVCDGTACHIKGSQKIIDEYSKLLGIGLSETTDDKVFHLQVVRCLGCCGLAPVVVVNGKTYGKTGPEQASHIIEEWRNNVG